MDNFIDKLAQKFNAQELIKANTQAETAQMERLQLQVAEYEKILQEMRRLNYKNTELVDKIDRMIGDNAGKIQSMKDNEKSLMAALRDITEEQRRNHEAEIELLEKERALREEESRTKPVMDPDEITKALEDRFTRSDDFVHKENVKVYRNVQAVVTEEADKLKDMVKTENEGTKTWIKNEISEIKEDLGGENDYLEGQLKKVKTFSIISMLTGIACVALLVLKFFIL